jgi:hypothetical protein
MPGFVHSGSGRHRTSSFASGSFQSLQPVVGLCVVTEDDLLPAEHERSAHEIRIGDDQVDRLLLRQLPVAQRLERGAAAAEDCVEAMLVDQLREQVARRRFLGEIVFDELESATFQVCDRLAAARSRRFEVDLEFLRHFFLTHQAFGSAGCVFAASA